MSQGNSVSRQTGSFIVDKPDFILHVLERRDRWTLARGAHVTNHTFGKVGIAGHGYMWLALRITRFGTP